MTYKVDSAILMAAGTSSRFVPLSYEKPKALIKVRGEILIERQIRQLQEAGVPKIVIVTGYKKEQFDYLKDKFGVILVDNPDYLTKNNNATLFAAREYIQNSYICSIDNYFINNPFSNHEEHSYYSAQYADGKTEEWCLTIDSQGLITDVRIGGENTWYMMGHVFWSSDFSEKILRYLDKDLQTPEKENRLWEYTLIDHLQNLPIKVQKYNKGDIFEFDSLDELREFDPSYRSFSDSKILQNIAKELKVEEAMLHDFQALKNDNQASGFIFSCNNKKYCYKYTNQFIERLL